MEGEERGQHGASTPQTTTTTTATTSGRCDLVPISLRIPRDNGTYMNLHFTWDASEDLVAANAFVEVLCRENGAAGGERTYAQLAESIIKQAQEYLKNFNESTKASDALRVINIDFQFRGKRVIDRLVWNLSDDDTLAADVAEAWCTDMGLQREYAAAYAHQLVLAIAKLRITAQVGSSDLGDCPHGEIARYRDEAAKWAPQVILSQPGMPHGNTLSTPSSPAVAAGKVIGGAAQMPEQAQQQQQQQAWTQAQQQQQQQAPAATAAAAEAPEEALGSRGRGRGRRGRGRGGAAGQKGGGGAAAAAAAGRGGGGGGRRGGKGRRGRGGRGAEDAPPPAKRQRRKVAANGEAAAQDQQKQAPAQAAPASQATQAWRPPMQAMGGLEQQEQELQKQQREKVRLLKEEEEKLKASRLQEQALLQEPITPRETNLLQRVLLSQPGDGDVDGMSPQAVQAIKEQLCNLARERGIEPSQLTQQHAQFLVQGLRLMQKRLMNK